MLRAASEIFGGLVHALRANRPTLKFPGYRTLHSEMDGNEATLTISFWCPLSTQNGHKLWADATNPPDTSRTPIRAS